MDFSFRKPISYECPLFLRVIYLRGTGRAVVVMAVLVVVAVVTLVTTLAVGLGEGMWSCPKITYLFPSGVSLVEQRVGIIFLGGRLGDANYARVELELKLQSIDVRPGWMSMVVEYWWWLDNGGTISGLWSMKGD